MTRFTKTVAISVMAVAAVMAAPAFAPIYLSQGAWAASGDASGGAGAGEKGAQSGQDTHQQSGQDNQGGQGAGQGGPDPSSDSKGPQAGIGADQGSGGTGGVRPPWASEGIPEVELGRLSVARSPDLVLERALAEADAALTPAMVSFYNLTTVDAIVQYLEANWGTEALAYIDSPLQNLALFQDLLDNGEFDVPDGTTSIVDQVNVNNITDVEKLLAVFLGTASDKTVPVTEDTVKALLTILGDDADWSVVIDKLDITQIQQDAEDIRSTISELHG